MSETSNVSRPVAKALQVLETLGRDREPRSLAEISRACGIAKATALRYLGEMAQRGYVCRNADGEYSIGARVLDLGRGFYGQFGALSAAHGALRALSEKTGETAHLGILQVPDIVYIDIVESPQRVRAFVEKGERLPAHCVAAGLAILTYSEPAQFDALLARPLDRFTSRTLVDRKSLLSEFRKVEKQGYAAALGQWKEEVVGISAPIFSFEHKVLGAIGVSLPSTRANKKRVAELGEVVMSTAASISHGHGMSIVPSARSASHDHDPANAS